MLFLLLTRNTLFGRIRFKTQKVVHWKWSMMPRLIWIWRIQWWHSLFLFLTEISFFGQFLPKNQNYLLKLEFWNLEPRPIWISFDFHFFLCQIGNTFFEFRLDIPTKTWSQWLFLFFSYRTGSISNVAKQESSETDHPYYLKNSASYFKGKSTVKNMFFCNKANTFMKVMIIKCKVTGR